MNKFNELNYYEILEIPIDASLFEIRRAYRNALEVYSKNSLLTYSLFIDEERVNILKKIEHAYNTLSDRAKRTAYDASLGDKSMVTDISQGHSALPACHKRDYRKDFILDANEACLTSDGAWETEVTSQHVSVEARAERSLMNTDRVSQQSIYGESVERESLGLTGSFLAQVPSRILVIISLLALILMALFAIFGPPNLPGK